MSVGTQPLRRIVSGGQTGVDRGVLDAALACAFPCGGWCPAGRLAEDGRIEDTYPLQELPGGGYEERTRRNVEDSDGTVAIYFGALEGGTELAVRHCERLGKPHLVIDAEQVSETRAARRILAFIEMQGISTLNVAGPRLSQAPKAHEYARAVFERVLSDDSLINPRGRS